MFYFNIIQKKWSVFYKQQNVIMTKKINSYGNIVWKECSNIAQTTREYSTISQIKNLWTSQVRSPHSKVEDCICNSREYRNIMRTKLLTYVYIVAWYIWTSQRWVFNLHSFMDKNRSFLMCNFWGTYEHFWALFPNKHKYIQYLWLIRDSRSSDWAQSFARALFNI